MAFQYNHYYEIYNSSSGKYVNLNGDHENNVVNNGEKVTVYARTNNPDQRWALERYGSDNQVRIVLQRGGGWYALNYNTENTNCIVWHLNSAPLFEERAAPSHAWITAGKQKNPLRACIF